LIVGTAYRESLLCPLPKLKVVSHYEHGERSGFVTEGGDQRRSVFEVISCEAEVSGKGWTPK